MHAVNFIFIALSISELARWDLTFSTNFTCM